MHGSRLNSRDSVKSDMRRWKWALAATSLVVAGACVIALCTPRSMMPTSIWAPVSNGAQFPKTVQWKVKPEDDAIGGPLVITSSGIGFARRLIYLADEDVREVSLLRYLFGPKPDVRNYAIERHQRVAGGVVWQEWRAK